MPIYEYLCQDCAYTFEVKQSIKEEPVAVCARCGRSVKRIISAPAIMFKGSGWYVTDYSDKLKPPSGEAAQTPKADAPATSSTPAPAAPPAASSGGSSGSGSSSPAPSSTGSGSASQ